MSLLTDKQIKMLQEPRIASVATIDPAGMPHLTSVWFLYEEDQLVLGTPSKSAKARNLQVNPRIAIMIDARKSYEEAGLTAIGEAEIIEGEEAALIVQRLHEKYLTPDGLSDPQVGPAFAAMDDIAIRLTPSRWLSWDMAELDTLAFGGAMARNQYFKGVVP